MSDEAATQTRLLQLFRRQSEQNYAAFGDFLTALTTVTEADQAELVRRAFIEMHGIKGGARILGLGEISRLAHQLEDILDKWRKTKIITPAPSEVLAMAAPLPGLLARLGSAQTDPTPDQGRVSLAEGLYPDLTGMIARLQARPGLPDSPFEVHFEGGEVTLPSTLIRVLYEPLLHLINNALTNCQEAVQARQRLDKPPALQLTIRASRVGQQVWLSVRDDGTGIDPVQVRETAVRRGFLSAEAAASLSDQAVLDIIWQPGFTTVPVISDRAGRGVGLDVVRQRITDLGGSVRLESTLDVGTTVTLELPDPL